MSDKSRWKRKHFQCCPTTQRKCANELEAALSDREMGAQPQLNAADIAHILVEHTDGVLWKQPENDGHISRFTLALNAALRSASPVTEGKQ